MMDKSLDNLRASAESVFAPGHGHWLTINGEQVPAMSVTKRDIIALLDRVEKFEKIAALTKDTT